MLLSWHLGLLQAKDDHRGRTRLCSGQTQQHGGPWRWGEQLVDRLFSPLVQPMRSAVLSSQSVDFRCEAGEGERKLEYFLCHPPSAIDQAIVLQREIAFRERAFWSSFRLAGSCRRESTLGTHTHVLGAALPLPDRGVAKGQGLYSTSEFVLHSS